MKIEIDENETPRITGLFLRPEQIAKIIENVKAYSPNYLYPFLYTLAHTGARRIELMRLKRSDLNFESGLINIKDNKGRARKIKVYPALMSVIKAHLATHECDHVFTAPCGRRLSESQFQKALDRFKKAFPMGVEWNFYSFRRSYGANYLRAGGDIHQLQNIMGVKILDTMVDWVKQENCLRKDPSLLKKYKEITNKKSLKSRYTPGQLPKEFYPYLTHGQIEDISNRAKEYCPNYLYPFIYLISQTGLRMSEAMRLKKQDIFPNLGIIKVSGQRLGKSREIEVKKELCKILLNASLGNESEFIFATPTAKNNGKNYIQFKLIQFKLKHRMEKNWCCQTLRETFAHNFVRDGGSKKELNRILGQKGIEGMYVPHFGVKVIKNMQEKKND